MVGENLLCEWPVVSFSPSQLLSPLLASEGWQSEGGEIIRGQDRVSCGGTVAGGSLARSQLSEAKALTCPAFMDSSETPCGHSPCDVGGVFCLFGCHSPEPLVCWWPTVHSISLLGSPRPPRLCSPAELKTPLARLFGAWETLAGPHGRVLGKQPRPVQALLPILLPRLPQLSEPFLHPQSVGTQQGWPAAAMEGPWSGLRGGGCPPPTLLENDVGSWPQRPAKKSLHRSSPPLLTCTDPSVFSIRGQGSGITEPAGGGFLWEF